MFSPPEGVSYLQSRLTSWKKRPRKSLSWWDKDWMRRWTKRRERCAADWLRRGGSSSLTWWWSVAGLKQSSCALALLVIPLSLLQVRVHKQRERDLSNMSRNLEKQIELSQHLKCWQNLLTAQSLELAELINNLDEEAAADIRKVLLWLFTSQCHQIEIEAKYKTRLYCF